MKGSDKLIKYLNAQYSFRQLYLGAKGGGTVRALVSDILFH